MDRISPATVALVTAPQNGHGWSDEETPLLQKALELEGITARTVPWRKAADWSSYRMVVIRSPWDLYERFYRFEAWLRQIDGVTTTLNPSTVVRWNLDKRYLRELASAGIPVVPTTYVATGEAPRFPQEEFVVKPVTSGGAVDTARYQPHEHDRATRHVESLHRRGQTAVVQPYLEDVDHTGERALVFFNNRFSHAIRKQAVLRRGDAANVIRPVSKIHPDPKPYQPTADELSAAKSALAAVPNSEELLYARVDLANSSGGVPFIMELELTDPILFLGLSNDATQRFAKAIIQRL
jgi:glutathione synthase/RimK-type ligase-like ATP-grasp enzyme